MSRWNLSSDKSFRLYYNTGLNVTDCLKKKKEKKRVGSIHQLLIWFWDVVIVPKNEHEFAVDWGRVEEN